MAAPTVRKPASLTPLVLLLILIAVGIGLVYLEDNAQYVHDSIGTFLGLRKTTPSPSPASETAATASPALSPTTPAVASPIPTATATPPVIRQRYSVGSVGEDD